MEYITEEQFSEQPKEIQKVFLEWWKPSVGDLYCNIYNNQQDNVLVINNCQIEFSKSFTEDIKKFGYPLLVEGQLRKFIEDKIGYINITYSSNYEDMINKTVNDNKNYLINSDDLFRAYWKVALKIAESEVNING
jgi:hypothetical protein